MHFLSLKQKSQIGFYINMRKLRIVNDILLYASFCFLAGTGLMMKYSFVKGAGMQTVLSFGKKAWENYHLWVGIAATIFFIVHFALNARFFQNVLKTRAAYFVFLLIGFGGAIILALWPTTTLKCGRTSTQTHAAMVGR